MNNDDLIYEVYNVKTGKRVAGPFDNKGTAISQFLALETENPGLYKYQGYRLCKSFENTFNQEMSNVERKIQ